MPATPDRPTVSVLMPTYRQDAFLTRAIGSLLAQDFPDFELVVVNDGSDDTTDELVRAYDDSRIRYLRWTDNRGLGAALNAATRLARGEFIAYLPSDDYYDRDHLSRCVAALSADPGLHLVHSGLRWVRRPWDIAVRPVESTATLHGDRLPEAGTTDATKADRTGISRLDVRSGNYLALVQVVHRRTFEDTVRWRERTELVSDSLELDFWEGLRARGARFAATGATTCEWGDHPDQRHKIIAGRGAQNANQANHGYGLSRYRQFYRVPSGTRLNWQPVAQGEPVDERVRYLDPQAERAGARRRTDGLRILLVGAMGYNPDQLLALERDGHHLGGLWSTHPHFWETTGPLPFGDVEYLPHDRHWYDRVRDFAPDVIYGSLNWPNLPLLHQVQQAGLAPFVLHLKEGTTAAMQAGSWPALRDLVLNSAGRIFISPESRDWFDTILGPAGPVGPSMVLDGDLPLRDWMTDQWADPVGDDPDEVHTVCIGRILIEPMLELAERGIHVHHYGSSYRRWAPGWLATAEETPFLHLHGHLYPRDWVAELSRYDAAWLHVFTSDNGGDLRSAAWTDINLPARISTYAIAGLPWIFRRNAGQFVGVERLADRLGVGIGYSGVDDLAERLVDERKRRVARTNMRAARHTFTFDHHVPELVSFLRRAAATR